jgi:predicted dehydrogenase
MGPWKRKLRYGMVGGGQGAFIGGVHRIVAAMDGQAELVAGCFSRDPENTRITGEQLYLDPARCYDTYEAMAAAEAKLPADQRIDFVAIVTPNVSHFPIAKTFLEAGFHVVCDKPMTYSLDEAKELVKIVEKTGLVFALTHNYTGNAMVRQAREMFKSGQLGEIRKVIVEYLQDFLLVPAEKLGSKQAEWRVDPAQSGIAGTMGDIGTHSLNLLEYVTGEKITELCADVTTFMPDRKLDDDVNCLLHMEGGGKGAMIISQASCGEENGLTLRVYGTKGAIKWAQEHPNYLDYYPFGEPRQTLTRGAGYLVEAAAEVVRIPSGHPEGYLEAFGNIYRGAFDAIRAYIDGKPMKVEDYKFPTVYDGLRGMELIYGVIESGKKGATWVKV